MTLPTLPSPNLLGHRFRFQTEPLQLFLEAARLGGLVWIPVGPIAILAISDPEAIHQMLVTDVDRFVKATRGQRIMQSILGTSLLTDKGETWRVRRKRANPLFTRQAVSSYFEAMRSTTAREIATWRSSERFDLAPAMADLTLRIAAQSLLGRDLDDQERATVHHGLHTVLDGFVTLTTAPYPWPEKAPFPSGVRHRRAVAELDHVVRGIIVRRRAGPVEGDDFLARMHQLPEPISDDDLRNEIMTLLLAGHETTANAMAWTLGLLGRHPDVQRRLQADLDAWDPERDVDGPPFLGAVFKESLRLFPPAWVLTRAATEDTTLQGHAIPKGAFCFISMHTVHRLPQFWKDPEGFDPDRWLQEPAPSADAFMPFGGGPRKCIGERFAMAETQIMLSGILRRFRVALAPGGELVPHPSVTLRPRAGIWVTADERA